MLRYAGYRLHNIRDVEDALQNIYLRVLSDGKRIKDIRNPRAYLYRMLSNECTNILRESSRTQSLNIAILEKTDQEYQESENFEEEFAIINKLLAALTFEQSETIRLHLHGNLTFQEIADLMNVPLPTAKARFRYGIEKIKTKLKSKQS